MFDSLFMPALTFTLLVAALAAFASEMTPSGAARLDRVVVSAPAATTVR